MSLKACRIHWIHLWHHVRDKVVSSTKKIKEKQIFNKIAMGITESYGNDALSCFQVLCLQTSAKVLLNVIKNLLIEEAEIVDRNHNWSAASK